MATLALVVADAEMAVFFGSALIMSASVRNESALPPLQEMEYADFNPITASAVPVPA